MRAIIGVLAFAGMALVAAAAQGPGLQGLLAGAERAPSVQELEVSARESD